MGALATLHERRVFLAMGPVLNPATNIQALRDFREGARTFADGKWCAIQSWANWSQADGENIRCSCEPLGFEKPGKPRGNLPPSLIRPYLEITGNLATEEQGTISRELALIPIKKVAGKK